MERSRRTMLTILGLAFLLLSESAFSDELRENIKVISTRMGDFKGLIRRLDVFGETKEVEKYLGIPYAEPTKRFQKPVLKNPIKSNAVYDATYYRHTCPQMEIPLGGIRRPDLKIETAEDCLFINIVKPAKATASQGLPVMVWFYGGGFNVGSAQIYPGDMLSAYGDVIIVTLGYRLTVFGFLSTGDDVLPGNLGLWDQHIALQWVNKYITDFGGNPENVAIFGGSAGSASVVYQSIFPRNKNLFQRAIGMSGSITCPWSFQSNPLDITIRFGQLLGCDTSDSVEALRQCIASKPTEQILDTMNKPENGYLKFPLDIVSVTDDEFLKSDPYKIINHETVLSAEAKHFFSSIDFMTGITSGEGTMNIHLFAGVHDTENFALTREQFEQDAIPKAAKLMYGDNIPEVVFDMLIHKYTDWANPDDINNIRKSFLEMTGDYVFGFHAKLLADLHANLSSEIQNAGTTYTYVSHAFPSQHILWTPTWVSKPNHADDLTFLFGYDKEGYVSWTEPYSEDYQPEDWELQLSKIYMTLITNFVKTG